ncbi:MAG: B12-binding domain-containing radical SAM protein [bacterium]|nr:B12-binding domain-containing radical SAM protein [bacterium]
MARIAFVKVFTGLNLGVSQLSGELQRAGHESLIVYFKDYVVAPEDDSDRFERSELCGTWVAARGKEFNCNLYTRFSEREYDLLVDTLREFQPDAIGLSMCSVPIGECAQVTEHLKRHFRVPILWGGSGPTLEPERCLQWADFVCVGEGEKVILEVARRLDAGESLVGVPGLHTRAHDGALITPEAYPLIHLDDIAVPDFDLARCVYINDDKRRRNVYPHNLGRQYHIMTQRGCPYSCSFCIESWYQEQWGKKESLRRRSVDAVIAELVEAKRKFDPHAVMFWDDVFTLNPRWLREFAPRYKAEIGLPFWCYTYPRTTRRDDLLLLKDAGLRSVTVGIQSGSEKVLKAYDRPVEQDLAIRAAQTIIDCGLSGFFDLITRSEYETDATCRETFDFLLRFPQAMQTVGFYPMIRFPGYGYERGVLATNQQATLDDHDYAYWHRLYLLTRTTWPEWVKRRVGTTGVFRRWPKLIEPLLPKTLPFFYLDNGALDLAAGTLELTDEHGSKQSSTVGTPAAELPRAAAG